MYEDLLNWLVYYSNDELLHNVSKFWLLHNNNNLIIECDVLNI